MAKKQSSTGAGSPKAKAAPWADPDDAPGLRAAFFKKATLKEAGKAVGGRPKLPAPKQAISIRLDPDIVDKYRAKGNGWQTALNADLRAAVGLTAAKPRAPKRGE